MPVDFHGYELLLLRRLQNDPALCAEWITKLQKKIVDDEFDLGVNTVHGPCGSERCFCQIESRSTCFIACARGVD